MISFIDVHDRKPSHGTGVQEFIDPYSRVVLISAKSEKISLSQLLPVYKIVIIFYHRVAKTSFPNFILKLAERFHAHAASSANFVGGTWIDSDYYEAVFS